MAKRIQTIDLDCYYGDFLAVSDINIEIEPRSVTAFIGPSGCGKTTFLRTLNRMHEVTPGARAEGKILLDDEDINAPNVDPVRVRSTIGMVFQAPEPIPDHVYPRERTCRIPAQRDSPKPLRSRQRARALPNRGKLMGRGQGSLGSSRRWPLRWAAAASLHCSHDRDRTRCDSDGRAGFSAGPDFYTGDRSN